MRYKIDIIVKSVGRGWIDLQTDDQMDTNRDTENWDIQGVPKSDFQNAAGAQKS